MIKITYALLFINMFSSCAYSDYTVTQKNLTQHVEFLSSDALEGRLTGSQGEKLATQYIAKIFAKLGLEPAGDNGTFFQNFTFTTGVVQGKNNFLQVIDHKGQIKRLKLNIDWRPLPFSDNATFTINQLVFAEYGITTPQINKLPPYDSYHNLNVKNKWVLVLNSIPNDVSAQVKRAITPFATLRYKTFNAKEHGAKGIIFINDSNKTLHSPPLERQSSNSGIIAIITQNAIIKNPSHKSIHIEGQVDLRTKVRHARNVLAKIKLAQHNQKHLIIGAHVDHLGHGEWGGSLANSSEAGMIHSGADDNASGVASILEAAAALSDLKALNQLHGDKDLLFAAWSGEEFGLLGSAYFAKKFMKDHKVAAAINLDMIGHLQKQVIIQGVGSSQKWPKIIDKIPTSFKIITQEDPYLPTDSTSFYLQHIPSINIFSGAQDTYHTPRDKPDTLNYQGIKDITNLLITFVRKLEQIPHMSFQEVRKQHPIKSQTLKIYLGTIPDYANLHESGVKLAGIVNNSPAEIAGLKPNDVIVELNNKKIHDIYDYTFILNSLRVNKSTKLIVLRTKSLVTLHIIPRYRE